ncbi:MAG: DUF1501 domain-containing protein [Pirellulaceae bacterium]|nr:DUF1501 domain-containing protein [Pirellulaceae bacterium]
MRSHETCQPAQPSRRRFIQASCAGLPALLAGVCDAVGDEREPVTARAKSVVLLWMWGGPSQLDTFDPKPAAPAEIRGPFTSIQTRTPGLQFCELFPRLARRTDKMSVVRSQINYDNAHRIAGSIALTGGKGRNDVDADYQPNFGSIVHRVLERRSKLPPFVAIGPGKMRTAIGELKGFGGGVWGSAYDPFPVHCSELADVELPTLRLAEGLSVGRLADRHALLKRLQQIKSTDTANVAGWNHDARRALDLLTLKENHRTFDLRQESDASRGRYGFTQFGQSCLLARRLVEAHVPYIQVNWSQWVENIYDTRTDFGWDTHWLNFEHMADRHGPIFDRAMAALLDDLDERGLLKSTLVVAMGEFGRTPKISANGGRDHWQRCQSSLWAGGGVPGGQVIGASDKWAGDPTSNPISPEMVGATILELMGITTDQRAELRVLDGGTPVEGLA